MIIDRGSALIDYFPPTYDGPFTQYNGDYRPDYTEDYWSAVTCYSKYPLSCPVSYACLFYSSAVLLFIDEGFYEDDVSDSFVTYDMVVYIEPDVSVGSTYSFETKINIGMMAEQTITTHAVVTDMAPSMVTLNS